ncbi:pyrroline-5-carboxylate reductase [Aquibacillus kalidii]|uniref:pyrroline-5-carboxylate reductase n=1 Tax=Aquibacillus kalidii TaxID=2762597 RepID=UPI002E2C7E7A|nr:pyrroline-5-carboxylate reductase [Aquibacillus kalidii]
MNNKVAFIGAGSIAEAIISGIIVNQFVEPTEIMVSNKSNKKRLSLLADKYGINGTQDMKQIVEGAEIIILSIKPADIVVALDSIKPYLNTQQMLISVLAGISSDFISDYLGMDIAVIRAMPNTSAMIGHSATSLASGRYASQNQLDEAKRLLGAIGSTTVVEEKDMHTITALAGSGPAFFYYTVESLEEAAKESGLDQAIAKELIIQTLVGAAEMLKATNESPSELRKKITSPGGTTQRGIETLDKYRFQEAILACIEQASKRSEELGNLFEKLPRK